MITYIKGDLLNTTDSIIAHGCNAQGVMGSGVALAIKNKWPEVYESYKAAYSAGLVKLGYCQLVKTHDKKIVANIITQEYFGKDGKKYVDYDAVKIGLTMLRKYMDAKDIASVSMPKIGCGLGGGSWDKMSKIIEEILKNKNVNIYEL